MMLMQLRPIVISSKALCGQEQRNGPVKKMIFTGPFLCRFYFKRFINTMRMEAFRKSTTTAPSKGMTK